TGPGGSYTTRYQTRGRRILAISGCCSEQEAGPHPVENPAETPDRDAPGPWPAPRRPHRPTLLDRLLGIDRIELSAASAAQPHAHPHAQPQARSRPLVAAAGALLMVQR